MLYIKFLEKNRYNGSIIYNNRAYGLKEYFDDIDNNNHNDIIEFLLCLDKNSNDLSYLFSGCDSLISIDYYKINNHSFEINKESKVKPSTINNCSNSNESNNIYNSLEIS